MLEMRQNWREAPLSDVCEIKIKAKIWLAGREASPLAGQGRHFRIACEEVFGKRHSKRAFDGTKLSKIYRKLNFGHSLGKINNKPNRKFEAGQPRYRQK